MIDPAFWRLVGSPLLWAGLALVASTPFWLPPYFLGIMTLTLFYVAFASAWNVAGGIAGLMSLGHSIFVGLGAFLSTALLLNAGLNMWLGVAVSCAAAVLCGIAISWLDHRFRLGHLSFALITLAFAEVFLLVVIGNDFLGGASGLILPNDRGRLAAFEFGGARGYVWLSLGLVVLCLVVNLLILHTRLGYQLRCVRDNEDAAQAIGVDLLRAKMAAMGISAALSAVIGAAYARYTVFVDPYLFAGPNLSIEILLISTIGGLGTPFGPPVAAALLVPFGEIVRAQFGSVLPGLHYFIYGALITFVILTMPRGLVPTLRARLRRGRARAANPGDDGAARTTAPETSRAEGRNT